MNPTRINRVRYNVLAYFKQCPWDEWWTEFMTARDKTGSMVYATSWQFAKAKSEKNPTHLSVLYRAIGPKPIDLDMKSTHQQGNRRALRDKIPYLGDWQQLRAKAYFYDNESVDSMRVVIAERLNGLEAGRGAATVILDYIAEYVRYNHDVDEAFGKLVVPGIPILKQMKRAEAFLKLKDKLRAAMLELMDKYLACHGISHNGLNDLGQLVMSVSASATNSALAGTVAGTAMAGEFSPAARLLCGAIADKMRIFNMPPPTAVAEEMGEAIAEERQDEDISPNDRKRVNE